VLDLLKACVFQRRRACLDVQPVTWSTGVPRRRAFLQLYSPADENVVHRPAKRLFGWASRLFHAELAPPERDPSISTQRGRQLSESYLLVNPVKRRGGGGEVEILGGKHDLLEWLVEDLDRTHGRGEAFGQPPVGLDCDEIGTELQQAPRRHTGARPDLHDASTGPEPAPLNEELVHARRVARTSAIVGVDIGTEQVSPFLTAHLRHGSIPWRWVVDPAAADHRRHDRNTRQVLRIALERIPLEHDEVGEIAG
jgi:hypothetical protein